MPPDETRVPHGHGRAEAVTRLKIYTEHARSFANLDVSWTDDDARFSTSVQGVRMARPLRVEEESLQLALEVPLTTPFGNRNALDMGFHAFANHLLDAAIA